MLRLRHKTKKSVSVTKATKILNCDICNRKGISMGYFPLRRPECCKPIRVCSSGHNKHEILSVFHLRCSTCLVHAQTKVPEVEFISKMKSKSKSKSKSEPEPDPNPNQDSSWSDEDSEPEPEVSKY